MGALLEQYTMHILGTDPPPASTSADQISAWREQVRQRAGAAIGETTSQGGGRPAAGTGGMLSVAEEHLLTLNPKAKLALYAQEVRHHFRSPRRGLI